MTTPAPRDQRFARINQGIAILLWILVVVLTITIFHLRPEKLHGNEEVDPVEIALLALALLLTLFALSFHLAAWGWRRQGRWVTQLTPLGVLLFIIQCFARR